MSEQGNGGQRGVAGSGASRIQEGSKRDKALVALHKSGDARAFGRLFDFWFDPVYDRLIHRGVAPREAAALEAEAFTGLWQAMQVSGPTEATSVLLLRATRKVSPSTLSVQTGKPGPTAEERLTRGTDAAALGGDRAVAALLWDGADVLGDRAREVLDLSLRHRLSPEETAAVLGEKPATVKDVSAKLPVGFGTTARARILWRGGEPEDGELADALSATDSVGFDAVAVRTINAHAKTCDQCRARAMVALPLTEVFRAIPIAVAPSGLKEQVAAALVAAGVGLSGSAFVKAEDMASAPTEQHPEKPGDTKPASASDAGTVAAAAALSGIDDTTAKAATGASDSVDPKGDSDTSDVKEGSGSGVGAAGAVAAGAVAAGAVAAGVGAAEAAEVKDGGSSDTATSTTGADSDTSGEKDTKGNDEKDEKDEKDTGDGEGKGGPTDTKGISGLEKLGATATATGLAGAAAASSGSGPARLEPLPSGTSKLAPVKSSRDPDAGAGPPWKWILAGAATVVAILLIGVLIISNSGKKNESVATGDTVLRSTTTTEDPSQTTTTTRETTTTESTTTTTSEDPNSSTTTIAPSDGGGGGGGGGTPSGGGGSGGGGVTPTTARPTANASASVNPGQMGPSGPTPTLSWSVSSDHPVNVSISGPGFNHSDLQLSGSASVCPGSNAGGTCTSGPGTYYWNVTVTYQGQVIATANARLIVKPYP